MKAGRTKFDPVRDNKQEKQRGAGAFSRALAAQGHSKTQAVADKSPLRGDFGGFAAVPPQAAVSDRRPGRAALTEREQ